MAKPGGKGAKSSAGGLKITFGKKKKGKLKKKWGPKQQKPKAYRGQGR
jgi:hypothetical protein